MAPRRQARRSGARAASRSAAPAEDAARSAADVTPSPRAGRARDPPTPLKVLRPSESEAEDLDAVCAPGATPPRPPPGLELVDCRRSAGGEAWDWQEAEECGDSPGGSVKRRGGGSSAARADRIVRLLAEALATEEATAAADEEGFVPVTKLMRLRPELQRETFGSTRAVVAAAEACGTGLRLDRAQRKVRAESREELVRSVAESEVGASEQGAVSLRSLLADPRLQAALRGEANPEAFVRAALAHADSPVLLQGASVARRPRGAQIARAAEELFADERLARDARLRSKLAEGPGGAVPLTWLCSRYLDRLGVAQGGGPRATEVSATELCEALAGSAVLGVDPRRLTVWRRQPYSPEPAQAAQAPPPAAPAAPPGKEARVAAQLRQLLDFYFEPFTLQHNRYLLDLLARRVGAPEARGPWVAESLLGFRCSFEDLMGLGRIASALAKARVAPDALRLDDGGELRYLRASPDGQLRLQTPMEVRSFVPAPGASPELAASVVRYLSAAREQRGQAPTGGVSVVSYSVGDVLADAAPQSRQQREARVKRQLLMHHADIVCLQGLDPEGSGEGLAATLSEDGYGFALARGPGGEANAIFWDRSRWERAGGAERGAALAVDLRLIEDPQVLIRAVSARPDLAAGSDGGLGGLCVHGAPAIVCADLAALGGAEGAALLADLATTASAAQEVLGAEVAAPTASAEDPRAPLRSGASGLNKLRCEDAVLYRNLAPVVVLSGHTEGYLATMAPEEVAKQFPAFRLPLVAAFDWRRGAGAAPAQPAGAGRRRTRL